MNSPSPRRGRGSGKGGVAGSAAAPASPLPTLPPEGGRAVVLAAVTGAHGVTGEVRLKLFGDDVETLKGQKSFNDGALTASKIRPDNKGGAIARFTEIADRTAAEALRGTTLSVPRSALPPLGEDEYYHADLIGLPVVTEDGRAIGFTTNVMNYGATDIVEIAPDEGAAFMVPLIPAAVPDWNAERLVLALAFLP